jgi:hypothetical protein
MPNLTARQMLAQVPVRMAEGGEAQPQDWSAGMSIGRQSAIAAGQEDFWLGDVAKSANEWLANPRTAAEGYDAMIRSGIGVQDLLDAGISQDVISRALTAPVDPQQRAVNQLTLQGFTSNLMNNPNVAELIRMDPAAFYRQAQQFVTTAQKDGITPEERQQMQYIASQQGWGFADIRAAGVDPNILFGEAAVGGSTVDDGSAAAAAEAERQRQAAAAAEAERQRFAAADAATLTGGVTQGDMVNAVTPTYNAQQLQDIIRAAESQPAGLGTLTNPMDTRGSAETGSQSGVTDFLETYNRPDPFVAPTYTAPQVYQPLPAQPDIYAPGQAALDQEFRDSAPRTAIPGMPGQFDYSPAAKLTPATGAGYSWTPPSVTSRPRSLLSPLAIQSYGGTLSKSQLFAQNRALIDRNLRAMLGSSPVLRNTSTYNMLRNRVMSGEFGDAQRAFDPQTPEGQRFQAFLSSLEGSQPASTAGGATGMTTTGTMADSTMAGGYAAPINPIRLDYGGFRYDEFAKGGLVKKSKGSAKEELARFAEGGAVSERRPLSPDDPLYITESEPEEQVPLDELLRRQLEGIDSAPTYQDPNQVAQTESRSMLENLTSGARQIPQSIYQYGKEVVGSEDPLAKIGSDVGAVGGAMYEGIKQDPMGFALDMMPVIGEIRSGMDAVELSDLANEARAAGDEAAASQYEQLAAVAAAGATPLLGTASRAARRMTDGSSARSQMAEISRAAPTVENPFVGRLEAFVDNMQGRTTLPNLVNQIQGKLRDYDIKRVQRIMRDVPADTKFTPAEILEKLQANYNPANFRVTRTTNVPNFYESMDNPWASDNVQPRHSTIVLSVNDIGGRGISPEDAKKARDGLLRLDSDYRVMHDSDPTDYYGFERYYRPLVETLNLSTSDVSRTALATLGRIEDRIRTTAENVDVLDGFEQRLRNEAKGPTFFETHKNRLLEQGGVPAEQVLPRAYVNAFQQRYDDFATRLKSRLPEIERLNELPVFKAEDYYNVPASTINEAIELFLGREINPMLRSIIREQKLDSGVYINEQEAMLSGNQELRNFLTEMAQASAFAPGSNPSYVGQHPSVTGGVKNHVAFSRASDVTADIPEIAPNARGIYVHELQSDLLDDMRTTGGPRGLTTEELIERRPQLVESIEALDQRVENNVARIDELKKERRDRALSVEERYRMQQISMTDEEVKAQRRALEAIEALEQENYKIYQRRSGVNIGLENLDRRIRGDDVTQGVVVDEAFAGMDTNPKALQQLMIKTAVKAAVDDGLDFVALPSPQFSGQPQLYERLPQNARDVVKDLGEGFEVKQITLRNNDGPFKVTAIVWGRDAAGREGVNRLLTQGVPFKDGGEVSSAKTMLDRLISTR